MYRPEFRLAVLVPRGATLEPVAMTVEDAKAALAPDTDLMFSCTGNRCNVLRRASETWNLHFKLRDDGALILYCGYCAHKAREKGFTDGKDLFRFGVTIERALTAYEKAMAAWQADEAEQKAKREAWVAAEQQRRAMLRFERRFGINPDRLPDRLKVIRGGKAEDELASKPNRRQRKTRGFDWVAAEADRKARESVAETGQQPESGDTSAQA